MANPKVEVIETKDGSSSLFLPEMNETYHSTHGALTESKYVFLDKGLRFYFDGYPEKSTIRILEVGFGTGLNVWLTALAANDLNDSEHDFIVECTSLEKFPLAEEVIQKLNYSYLIEGQQAFSTFEKIHSIEWDNKSTINPNFILTKKILDIFDFEAGDGSFDVIYFDAFAPSKQPEMWGLPILQKMNQLLSTGGVLVTYCAQGQFKRDLKAAGFKLESLDGPPGKKEMTRGIKN